MRQRGLSGSFWPTFTQEALLQLVFGEQDRVAARWQALQPVDIDTLELGSFCLLPLVYRRLSDLGVSDPLLPRLAGTYRSTWYKNQLQLERLSSVVEVLRARSIEPIVFGGASLAVLSYAQLGFRPIPQVDVLVRPSEASSARDAALDCGWQPAGEGAAYRRFGSEDGMVLVLHAGVPPYLAGASDPGGALDAFLPRARVHRLGDIAVTTLDPADELLFVCGLGARATLPSVQWLLDAYHLLVARDRLDSRRLLEQAKAFRLVRPLRETLTYLDDVSEVLRIDDLLGALDAEPVSIRDLLAYRLAGTAAGRLGGMPQTLALHLRAQSAKRLPLVALKKALSRIARPHASAPNAAGRPGTPLRVSSSTTQRADRSSLAERKRSALS